MALLKEESYTIEDIYALPDGERAELIDSTKELAKCFLHHSPYILMK